MIETFEYVRRVVGRSTFNPPDYCEIDGGPWTGGRITTFVPIQDESKADLSVGNHILALPYWSEQHVLNKTDQPWKLTAFVGSVWYGVGQLRPCTRADYPCPPQTYWGNNEVRRGVWELNLSDYAQHPTLALPVVDESEWLLLESLADTKALGNVRKALVNLPLIIKERRETLQLIGDKVALIARGANALQQRSMKELKRSKPRNRRELARKLASEHLAFVFGVLPTIGEVEGAVEFIERDSLDFIRSRGVQSFRRVTKLEYAPISGNPSYHWAAQSFSSLEFFKAYSKGSEQRLISVRTALRYKLSSQLIGNSYALGFEPIGTTFDLIPLSFISGWISNFDYWVRTISPAFGLEFETGSRNRRRTHSFDVNVLGLITNGSTDIVGESKHMNVNGYKRRDDRTVLYTEPEASLHWDVEVGLFEVFAGISLTIQRYLKPLQRASRSKPFRYKGSPPKWLKEIRYTGRK